MIRENMLESVIINTDNLAKPSVDNDLYTTRKNFYDSISKQEEIVATIFVLGFNRIEKTKRCVECILKYTKDVQYELVLVDNGSEDETYNYFKSIKYIRKKIIKLTKNMGNMYAIHLSMQMFKSKYYVLVSNDVNVTQNWLSNLITCYESDSRIGFVCPVSDNISNMQEVNLGFNNFDEMQYKASIFNQSNPRKWQERMRLLNTITVLKREVIDNVGVFDVGFFHDFGEDDFSARIRRAGYKLILCGDTFVQHDHDFRNMEDKDPIQFRCSLEVGRKNYKDKFWEIDAWDDINNYEINLINMLSITHEIKEIPSILGIDVRCGTPVLEIRNFLRKNNINCSDSAVFTTQAKYYQDLLFATNGNVKCDRIEYLQENYEQESFDYIILGEPINSYKHPAKILKSMIKLAKPNAKILLKLKNILDMRMLLDILMIQKYETKEEFVKIGIEEMVHIIQSNNIKNTKVIAQSYQVPLEMLNRLDSVIRNVNLVVESKEIINRLCVDEYLFMIDK